MRDESIIWQKEIYPRRTIMQDAITQSVQGALHSGGDLLPLSRALVVPL
jgi:hypothetical protein